MRIGIRLLPGTIVLLLSLLGLGLLALLIFTFAPTLLEPMLVQPTPVVLTRDIGRIAFRCLPNGNDDICLIAANGAGRVNLTNHPTVDRSAIWSPDGDRIAFKSNRTGVDAIYTIQADGTQFRHVCDVPLEDGYRPTIYTPSWSPDGSRIAFVASPQGERTKWLYTFALATGTITSLTHIHDFSRSLVWSPDSTQIAVQVDVYRQVVIVPAEVGAQGIRMEVAETPAWYRQRHNPDPSGRYLVVGERQQEYPYYVDLYVKTIDVKMIDVKAIDVKTIHQVTEDLHAGGGAWAPGGEWILFTDANPAPGVNTRYIYLVHQSGNGLTRLAEGRDPVWAPE